MKFTIGKVTAIDKYIDRVYVRGAGKDAEFEEIHIGWRLEIEDGFSFIFPKHMCPDAQIGDEMRVEFYRTTKGV